MLGCLERIFDLKKDPFELKNLVIGPKCAVKFDNFDAITLEKVIGKDSWKSYCNNSEVLNIEKGEKNDEMMQCVTRHHEIILLRLHLMMSKLSVFVKYGNEPHRKFLQDVNNRKKEMNKNKNKDKNKNEDKTVKEGENKKGKNIEQFADYSNGTSSLSNAVMTCGVPIALELKGLEFEISPGYYLS